MMENVVFENTSGEFFMPAEYGILLKSFTAPAPTPKVFRESIDGMDGELDFTEYAGEVRFNDREVKAEFRDVSGKEYRQLMTFLAGQRLKLMYSAIPDYYFVGRCEEIKQQERSHVVDLECTFICSPYLLARNKRTVGLTVSSSASVKLKALRMSVIPSITVSAPMTLTYDGNTVALESAGTYMKPEIVITSTQKTLTIAGSGDISITWRDGVI